jgi:His-Xaa-Ser system radical SAM maturase HxsB
MLTQLRRADHRSQSFFRYRAVGDKVVVTSLEGHFVVLTREDFALYAEGRVEPGSPLFARLRDANLLAAEWNTVDAAQRMHARKSFLQAGPNLHIVVVTLRCNETCVYCHASRADMDAVDTDMSAETADRTVDLIFGTTSPSITIEFQGGEPLANFPIVRRIVERALEKNREANRPLEFTMVSNFSLLDEERLAFLLDHRVQLCTSIDGPAALHDKQRKLPGFSAFDQSARWIARVNAAYVERGLDPSLYHVEALLTTTAETLPRWKEVVDTYVDLGCRALFLRPVDPFGFADRTASHIEYPRAEYLAFYRSAVDYMLELNRRGVQVLERFAAIFLTKILGGIDPNYLDIRSPCGAGIGQIAYNYDGRVFTCDEGRMLHEMGDDTFEIGHVERSSYREIVGHETVRALAIASNLDVQPDCQSCAYNPYCGSCPVHNHRTQGTIFGRMRESTLCAVHKGIQDYLFEKIGEGDPEVLAIFRRWTTVRERSHFIQTCHT